MRVSLENKAAIGSREQNENASTCFPHKIMRNGRKCTSEKFKSVIKLVNRKGMQECHSGEFLKDWKTNVLYFWINRILKRSELKPCAGNLCREAWLVSRNLQAQNMSEFKEQKREPRGPSGRSPVGQHSEKMNFLDTPTIPLVFICML